MEKKFLHLIDKFFPLFLLFIFLPFFRPLSLSLFYSISLSLKHIYTLSLSLRHKHTLTHSHIHIHTQTNTHVSGHHKHTHTHTHTHTHYHSVLFTQSLLFPPTLSLLRKAIDYTFPLSFFHNSKYMSGTRKSVVVQNKKNRRTTFWD